MTPCGYAWLIEHFRLPAFPLSHRSQLGRARTDISDRLGNTLATFPGRYDPGESPYDQLVFALKYDGIELALLASLFPKLNPQELADWIEKSPTSKYARQIGFLYETLCHNTLPLVDRASGNYIDLLDTVCYVTAPVPIKNRRWRINNNLLTRDDADKFCPMVRRTPHTFHAEKLTVSQRLDDLRQEYSPELFLRAVDYAYLKETRSSYRIEHEEPRQQRVERFIELLREAGKPEWLWSTYLSELRFTQLQNSIVEERYQEQGFRQVQNYVGESRGIGKTRVHYICPPPKLASELMGWLAGCAETISGLAPIIQASVLSFAFVLIHPFEDGNGRLHRFLIHDTLVRSGFLPERFLLPISAVMVRKREEYDQALERFSRPLLALAEYELSDQEELELHNPTTLEPFYRYPDLTFAVEYLAPVIEESLEKELVDELHFLQCYDAARLALQAIVDMPDRRLELLLNLLRQNGGTLSQNKRAKFTELSDVELRAMELAFQQAWYAQRSE